MTAADDGQFEVEAILSGQASPDRPAAPGARPSSQSARRATALAAPVFRPYSGAGGLQAELVAQAAGHPNIAKLETIGKTIRARTSTPCGSPAMSPARGRPPADGRLRRRPARPRMDHAGDGPPAARPRPDGYGKDAAITALVNTNELWLFPVANPDG